jgi:hypothetical protein
LENKNNTCYPQGIIQINSDGSIYIALSSYPDKEEIVYNLLKKNYPENYINISYDIPLPLNSDSADLGNVVHSRDI